MRVLVTRGAADGQALAAQLAARGHQCLLEPLFEIRPLAVPQEVLQAALDGIQALLFTSANGVRALAAAIPERHWPVFAVGDATAAAARGAGFSAVTSAGGDVEDLATVVRSKLEPGDGALFHPAASKLAGDLKGELAAAGFEVRRQPLYEARPVAAFSAQIRRALADGEIDAVLIFSPRTGTSFVSLARTAGLGGACAGSHAVCLSQAVAESLAALPWAGLHVAARPTSAALMACLDTIKVGAKDAVSLDNPRLDAPHLDGGSERFTGSTRGTAEAMAQGTGSGDGPTKDQDATTPNAAGDDSEAPALRVIAAFGGIRPMAGKLGVAVSTVQGWRERAAIPVGRHDEIAAAAKQHNVTLDPVVLKDSGHPPAESAAGKAPASTKPEAEPAPKSGDPSRAAMPTVRSAGAPAVAVPTKASTPAPAAASKSATAASSAPASSASASDKTPSGPTSSGPGSSGPGSSGPGSSGPGSSGPGLSGQTAAAKPAPSSASPVASGATSSTPSSAPASRSAPAASPPPARRGGMVPGFILGVIVAVAVFLGTVFTREHWEPVVAGLLPGGGASGGPSAEEIAAALDAELEARLIGTLEGALAAQAGRVATLESGLDEALASAQQPSEPVDLSGLTERLDGLEQRLAETPGGDAGLETAVADLSARVDAVEQSGGASAAEAAETEEALTALRADRDALAAEAEALNGALTDLRQELADLASANQALEAAVAAQAAESGVSKLDQNVALVLALGQLRDALRGSGSFAAELAQVQGLMGDGDDLQAAIAPLTQFADGGLPTMTGLQRSFPATARAVVAAGHGGDDDGLLAGVVRSVSSIVTVRPVGEVEGSGAGPVVARAEARLQDGDLAGALSALDELTGRAAEAAAGWRGQAEARLSADRAVAALASRTIGQIAPAGG